MYVFDLEVINDIYEEESIDVVFERDVDHQDDRNYVPEEIEIKVSKPLATPFVKRTCSSKVPLQLRGSLTKIAGKGFKIYTYTLFF